MPSNTAETVVPDVSLHRKQLLSGEGMMSTMIRNWVQAHRYQETVRQLQALSAQELRALGIAPSQIEHLAAEVSGTAPRP